jgi:hypothetical protein
MTQIEEQDTSLTNFLKLAAVGVAFILVVRYLGKK